MMSKQGNHTKYIAAVLILSLLLCSCTSSKLLKSEYSSDTEQTRLFITKHLSEGDRVKIITTDGRRLEFKVREINSEAIIGEEQHVLFSEIARMEKRQFHAGKTGLLVGTVVSVSLILFITYCILEIFDFSS